MAPVELLQRRAPTHVAVLEPARRAPASRRIQQVLPRPSLLSLSSLIFLSSSLLSPCKVVAMEAPPGTSQRHRHGLGELGGRPQHRLRPDPPPPPPDLPSPASPNACAARLLAGVPAVRRNDVGYRSVVCCCWLLLLLLVLFISGHEVVINLWGERAVQFNGQSIHFMGQTAPAVAIFVGTTVHTYEGFKELSAGCACKWYINDDIEAINIFRNRLPASFPPIVHLPTPFETILQSQQAAGHPRKCLALLLNINLYHKEGGTFRCNVRIFRISTWKTWWGTFCTDCHAMSMPATSSSTQPDVYTCSRHSCLCKAASIRYTLFLLARDRTGEAQFSLCGLRAQQIVGLSALQVLRNSTRHGPETPNVYVAASQLRKTPTELTALLGMKCSFIVRVSANSFFGIRPTFQVTQVESFQPIKHNLSILDLLTPS